MTHDISPAISWPAPDLHTLQLYAAMLRRGFDAISELTAMQDWKALLTGGLIGYALHNLPHIYLAALSGEPHEPFEPGQSEWLRRRIRETFYLSAFDRVFTPPSEAETKAVTYPFSPAPPETQQYYTKNLYEVCQAARGLIWGRAVDALKESSPPAFTTEVHEAAHYCGLLALIFRNVPDALLNWPAFDEAEFRASRVLMRSEVPENYLPHYDAVFVSQGENIPGTA